METESVEPVAAPAAQRPTRRRGCLLFGLGVLCGVLLVPLALWLILLLAGSTVALRPSPPPPGQPDITIGLSRGYLQRSAERSAASQVDAFTLTNPTVTLAPHRAGGALVTVRGLVALPLVQADAVADFHLAAVDGELLVATERVAVGRGLEIPIPGSFIKDWLDDLVNREVQARIRSNPDLKITVTDVTATENQLIVEARLKE